MQNSSKVFVFHFPVENLRKAKEYLSYLLYHSSCQLDGHWKPQVSTCGFCSLRYRVVTR